MDFLSFSPDYWDGPRHNRHYFCEELSKSHKVLFASPPFYLVKLIRELGRGSLNRSGVKKVNPNLINYSPSKLLFTQFRFPHVNSFFEKIRIKKINKLMKKNAFGKPIIIIWHPNFINMVDKFDSLLTIFYMYDQYSGYTGSKTNEPSPAEIKAIKNSDLVFVLSEKLQEDKKKIRPDIYHLPNAANFEMFSQSRADTTKIPVDISSIPGPRIGYIGTMNEKLNVKLLDFISTKRSEWSIVLIGRENYMDRKEKSDFLSLCSKKNVYWLGSRNYDTVPAYIKGLDVCLMCYIVNNWTYYGDPSKMHEYLASGKPTVAADLLSIRNFEHVVDIPDTFNNWINTIEYRLNEDNPELIAERIRVAKENSYEARIKTTIQIIENKLKEKYNNA